MTHRIGCIGLGIMGNRMLEMMTAHPDFDVAAIWDPDAAALSRLAEARPDVRAASSAEDLIGDDSLDGLYIVSPPASHPGYCHAAFDRRLPVLCEKPLTISLEAAAELVARVEGEGHVAAVNFPFASAPATKTIDHAVRSGEIGPVERIEVEVAFDRWPRGWQHSASWLSQRAEGGFTREVLSHFVFLLGRVFGPVEILSSQVDYPGDGLSAETGIEARLTAGGVPVSISGRVGGSAPDFNRCTVTGKTGAYRQHGWFGLEHLENGNWEEVAFGAEPARQISLVAQLDSLSRMLAGEKHGLATFREAQAVQTTIEALLRG